MRPTPASPIKILGLITHSMPWDICVCKYLTSPNLRTWVKLTIESGNNHFYRALCLLCRDKSRRRVQPSVASYLPNPLKSASIHMLVRRTSPSVPFLISSILSPFNCPQILPPIIQTVTVYVINHQLPWIFSRHIHPNQPMCVVSNRMKPTRVVMLGTV